VREIEPEELSINKCKKLTISDIVVMKWDREKEWVLRFEFSVAGLGQLETDSRREKEKKRIHNARDSMHEGREKHIVTRYNNNNLPIWYANRNRMEREKDSRGWKTERDL